jgi:hypothetical protein
MFYPEKIKADIPKKFKAQLKSNIKKIKPREHVLLLGIQIVL